MTDQPPPQEEAVRPSIASSPLSILALRDLLLKPTRFFARGVQLTKRPEVALVAWIAGMAYCIDRIDTNIMKAELGARPNKLIPVVAESWFGFWAFVILAGAVNGLILWYIAGWWYRKRINWSGSVSADRELARGVWAYQNLVWAVPSMLVTIAYTVLFSNYGEAWRAEEFWSVSVVIFVIWSCFTSYFAVTTAFTVSRARATLWFLVLPIAFYTIALGVIGFLFAMFGDTAA